MNNTITGWLSFILLAIILFILTGCAHGPLVSPSLSSAMKSNVAIRANVTKARSDINSVLKDNAIIARPDLTLTLQDADGQLVAANATIGQQASELTDKQKEIDTVTAQGNAAIAAKNAMEPKHKRDLTALFILFALGALFYFLGPVICAAYPPLALIPSVFEGTASALAGGLLVSGIIGLLVLFGVL